LRRAPDFSVASDSNREIDWNDRDCASDAICSQLQVAHFKLIGFKSCTLFRIGQSHTADDNSVKVLERGNGCNASPGSATA
jgi:hypothetical protein